MIEVVIEEQADGVRTVELLHARMVPPHSRVRISDKLVQRYLIGGMRALGQGVARETMGLTQEDS